MTTEHAYPPVRMFIAGEWCEGSTGLTFPVVNPATEQVIGEVPLAAPADLDRAAEAAADGFEIWRNTPIARRTAILHAAADLATERAGTIGRVMTVEQGKPLAEAAGEVCRVADSLRWHADDARRAYGRIIPAAPGTVLTVRREPIGPVAAFVPWNFPAGSPMRKISAALAAGCSIVIKASEETPGTACALVRCFEDAGVPAGALNLVFGEPHGGLRAAHRPPGHPAGRLHRLGTRRQAARRRRRCTDEALADGTRRARPGHRLRRRRSGRRGPPRSRREIRQRRAGVYVAEPVPGPREPRRGVHRGVREGRRGRAGR